MAAVAVAGAATAQVSVTGALGFGWEGVSPAVGGSTTGIKVTDGNVKFSASEDLGGGMSALTLWTFKAVVVTLQSLAVTHPSPW